MSLTCPRCQVENRDQAKRCIACNTDLSRVSPSAPRVTSTRLCPSGRHPMDPSWKVCHYCKADEEARRPAPPPVPPSPERRATVMESAPAASAPATPPPVKRRQTAFMPASSEVPAAPPASPEVPPAPPPAPAAAAAAAWPQPAPDDRPERRKTMFASPSPEAAAPPSPTPAPAPPPIPAPSPTPAPVPAAAPPAGRRIVGLLVTYSWRSDGQVFPVREGRNYVGSDPECDVAVDCDPQLSGRHATILYRGRGFWIDDEKSMNGTFVDGECVEEKQRLDNYSEVRTGSTVWRFIVVEPEAG